MINIKQIRESYNLIVEKDDDMRKLTALARSGLFDVKKIPMLKRALQKDSGKLSPVERKLLLDLLDSLMDEVLHSQQVYNKVKQDVMRHDMHESEKEPKEDSWSKKIPFMIMLKRKSVRQFGSGQTVGLYYAQALDKYISIAFGEKSALVDVNEDNLEEISQKLAQRAVVGRATQSVPTDDTPEEAARAAIAGEKYKRTIGIMGNNKSRPWGGKIAQVGAKAAANQAITNTKKDIDQQAKNKKISSLGGFVGAIRRGSTDPHDVIAAGGATVGYVAGKLVKGAAKGIGKLFKKEESSVKSKFYKKIEEKNQAEQEKLDELAPLLALGAGAARVAAPVVGRALGWGRNLLGKALSKGKDYLVGAGAAALASAGGGGASEKEVDPNKVTANRDFSLSAKPEAAKAVTGQGVPSLAQQNASNRNFANTRSEETIINQIREFVKSGSSNNIVVNENLIDINTNIAEKVLTVYESLNTENKAKFEKMLSESKESFRKAVNFALGY